MTTCENCKHWILEEEEKRHNGYSFGKCKKIREKIDCNVVAGWSGGYVESIETEHDFGCVFFQELCE